MAAGAQGRLGGGQKSRTSRGNEGRLLLYSSSCSPPAQHVPAKAENHQAYVYMLTSFLFFHNIFYAFLYVGISGRNYEVHSNASVIV